jgi:endonuclease/exonuclease/phosphatase family metal-dependent hydrolase
MKRFLRFLLKVISLFILVSFLFFFWASSSTLNKEEYSKIVKVDIPISISKDSIYSIVTYNIGYLSGMTNNRAVEKQKSLFDFNLELVKKEFGILNPDIIGFQEIDYNSSRSFGINQQDEIASLGYAYIGQAVNWDERYLPFPYYPISAHFGKINSGQSILSKYPILEQKRIVLERDQTNWFYRDVFYLDRILQVVKIQLDNEQEIIVMNLHLDAFNKELRKEQFDRVMVEFTSYKEEFPVILMGDFNSDPEYSDAVIQHLLEDKTFGNAAFKKQDYSFTFNTDIPFERLDFIFYDMSKIEMLDSRVLVELGQASDHYPVYMQFRFK